MKHDWLSCQTLLEFFKARSLLLSEDNFSSCISFVLRSFPGQLIKRGSNLAEARDILGVVCEEDLEGWDIEVWQKEQADEEKKDGGIAKMFAKARKPGQVRYKVTNGLLVKIHTQRDEGRKGSERKS